jgi:hypothetical protein
MKGMKIKPEDLVRVVPERLGDLLDRGVRDVAEILTEREEALRVAFRSTLPHASQLVTSLMALDGPQDAPGGRSAGLGIARRPPGILHGSSGR